MTNVIHVHIQEYMVTGVLMCVIVLENARSDELLYGPCTSAGPHFQANLDVYMHVCLGRAALPACRMPPPCVSPRAHISASCTLLMEQPVPSVP